MALLHISHPEHLDKATQLIAESLCNVMAFKHKCNLLTPEIFHARHSALVLIELSQKALESALFIPK